MKKNSKEYKITAFWDMSPCGLVQSYQHLWQNCHLHFQDNSSSWCHILEHPHIFRFIVLRRSIYLLTWTTWKIFLKLKFIVLGINMLRWENCERNFNLGRRITCFKKEMNHFFSYEMIMNSIKIKKTHRHGKLQHFL